jgi:ketol-acid reductoisomerase
MIGLICEHPAERFDMSFSTNIFPMEKITLGGTEEWIVRGGRHLFPLLPKAFAGIKQIGVIGWSSQGPAQAQNLRESLAGSGIRVKVGLRAGSGSTAGAEKAGFTAANGTLGEMYDVIAESDLVLLLIADAAQAENYDRIMAAIRPGTTLGLSHGFLLAYLKSTGKSFRPDINIIGVCPKGMGRSVRRLYEQGREINGAGINCSFAVHQDVNSKATDYALAWAIALGSPCTFETTLEFEYKSDIFGERGILLGAVHGIAESLYRHYRSQGRGQDDAFLDSAKSITSAISRKISQSGLLGVYEGLSESDRVVFEKAYCASYDPAADLLYEIYDEVETGNEIRSVVNAAQRLRRFPMSEIAGTEMWQVGRNPRSNREADIHPVTAGIYIATMMAQTDILRERGHPYSEIVNESIIEAIDSLNPYMDFKDVAYMVDNCSTTARLGARKWAPRFDYAITQTALPALEQPSVQSKAQFARFLDSEVHEALAVCLDLRPPVSIAVLD